VRYVAEVGKIPVTEAFVRQVVERTQGVIEAKLIPAQLPPVTTIQSYPGLSYQASPFYSATYPTWSPPQVVYASPSAPQPGGIVQRNVCEPATTNTPPTVKIYDTTLVKLSEQSSSYSRYS